MAAYGISITVQYVAWDTSTPGPKTGDSANHSLRWVKDGTGAAATNSPVEVDATNSPGVYKVVITATEAQCLLGTLCGKSSTANVIIVPTHITFVRLPNIAAGSNGGLPTVDGSNKIAGIQGVAFPTNFGDLTITASTGRVTAGTVSDKTGYSISGTKTTLDDLNDLDAAGIRGAAGLASANLDTQLSGIDTKTTNLPGDPADQSLIIAATDAIAALIGTPADTDIATDIANLVAALFTDSQAEPTGVPAADLAPMLKLATLFMMVRNKKTVTADKKTYYDDGGSAAFEADLSDDNTTYTESELNAI